MTDGREARARLAEAPKYECACQLEKHEWVYRLKRRDAAPTEDDLVHLSEAEALADLLDVQAARLRELEGPRAESIRVMHARAQGGANGFQTGWQAALSRVMDGDAASELVALVPTPPTDLVNGYDAAFWCESYNLLREAVLKNLGDYVHDDDVAEEAILVDAIETAGNRLAALTASPHADATTGAEKQGREDDAWYRT